MREVIILYRAKLVYWGLYISILYYKVHAHAVDARLRPFFLALGRAWGDKATYCHKRYPQIN